MKEEEEILKEATKEVYDSGNQSWHSIALVSIELGRKNLFNYLQEQSELPENKYKSLSQFFDKMDNKLF